MVAEMERLETAARLAMAHFPEEGGCLPSAKTAAHYIRLSSIAAVVIVSAFLGFTGF